MNIHLTVKKKQLTYAFTYILSRLSDRENAKNINRALEEKNK